MISSLYDTKTGLHSQMVEIMSDPNHNRPQITASVLNVRNYKTGRGLRDVTWSLLFTIAQQNCHLALTIMEKIIESGAGSWKDPRDFALFCNKYGFTRFIEPLMEMYVTQLLVDLKTFEKLQPSDIPRLHLSYAAKYSPRERSWLHPVLMGIWNRSHPLCAQIGSKSADKCAMIYRHSISKLNRAIETTEIAMCDGNWNAIKQSKIPLQTQMKYKRCFNAKVPGFSNAYFHQAMPDWNIIKLAYETNDVQWETVWNDRMRQIKQTEYVVPCLHLTTNLFEYKHAHLLYKTIATALITAKQSLFGNFVMVFSHLTHFVDLNNLSLVDAFENICDILHHEIEPCIPCGIDIIFEAMQASGFNKEDVANVQIQLIRC